MLDTHIKALCCPDCGAKVREIVSQGLFQVGGSSIGSSVLSCPRCGLLVESGLSEWEEKSALGRWWYFLRLVLWALIGSAILGAALAFCGTWLLVELELLRPRHAVTSRWIIYGITTALVVWLLLRNAFREIRASQARTRIKEFPEANREAYTG